MKMTNKLLIKVLALVLALSLIFSLTAFSSVNAYDYEEDPTVVEVIYHELDDGKDTLNSREVYDRDNKGNILTMTAYDYSEEGEWILSFKQEYEYDANGNITLEQDSDYDTETSKWIKGQGEEYIYDEKGNEIKFSRFEYTEENQTDKVYKSYSTTEYDNNGLMIKDSVYYLNDDDKTTFYMLYYYTYKYNESNQLIEQTQYGFTTKGDLSSEYISKVIKYNYAPNGEYASIDTTTYDSPDVFYLATYEEFEYDTQNRVSKLTHFTYHALNHQDLSDVDQYRYTYNGDEEQRDHYSAYASKFTEGYKEELLDYESTAISIDTKEEYKFAESNKDGEGKAHYLYGSHSIRVFENGYITLEKIYDINTDGSETQTGYKVITTKEIKKEEPKEESGNFPVWIIPTSIVVVLMGAYVGGYFCLFAKGKLSGKFFDIIYGWFKNLLSKLSKKN